MRVANSGPPQAPAFTPGHYAAPAEGEALRIGHGGPPVLELQQQLNAMGMKPPLALDGKLGPKTQAAMQKLLGSTTLDEAAKARLAAPPPAAAPATDGFENGKTPGPSPSLSPPTLNETPATAAPSAASGMTNRVLDNAFAENDSINPMKRGDDGKVKGWKELQTIFTETTGFTPSDAECQNVQSGKGLNPGGKSWCGIWACHILQKSGCNVKWDLTKGGMVGDVTHTLAPRFSTPAQYKAERQAFEQSVRPGDVITLAGAGNHHAIVTAVNPDGTVETMDGNKPHVGPGHQKLSNVTSFYRPNGD